MLNRRVDSLINEYSVFNPERIDYLIEIIADCFDITVEKMQQDIEDAKLLKRMKFYND